MKIFPILRTNSTDRLREMQMRGGRGSKILIILQKSFKYGPQQASSEAGQPKHALAQAQVESFLPPSLRVGAGRGRGTLRILASVAGLRSADGMR